MLHKHSFSVVIPTFNRAKLLREALESALAQDVPPTEILVIDDGSEDDTHDVVASFGDNVIYVRQARGGSAAARNHGVALARGRYVSFLDSDDTWLPGKLRVEQDYFERMPEADAIVSDAEYYVEGRMVQASGHRRRLPFEVDSPTFFPEQLLPPPWLDQSLFVTSSLTIRRDALARLGRAPFDVSLRRGQDWEMQMRMYYRCRVLFVPELLTCVRRFADDTRPTGSSHSVLGVRSIEQQRYYFELRLQVLSTAISKGEFPPAIEHAMRKRLDELKDQAAQSGVVSIPPRTAPSVPTQRAPAQPEAMTKPERQRLEGAITWQEFAAATSPPDRSSVEALLRAPVVHLGSYAHESWSVQRLVRAVVPFELATIDAARTGLDHPRVMCWHYDYWRQIPPAQRKSQRLVCFFHHHLDKRFAEPEILAGVCLNKNMMDRLREAAPNKPVWIAQVGGADDAIPWACRKHPTEKIRLLVVGNGTAVVRGPDGAILVGRSRKGAELLVPIAERLDPKRYAFVLIGLGWDSCAEGLRALGFTVLHPGPLSAPNHFAWFGEGDVYLMLAELEGGPLPLIETMGLGMWPIATRTGLVPDLIDDGRNGHVVSKNDGLRPTELADNVAARIVSLDRESLEAARPRVREAVAKRTWPNFKRQIEGILREVFGCGDAETTS